MPRHHQSCDTSVGVTSTSSRTGPTRGTSWERGRTHLPECGWQVAALGTNRSVRPPWSESYQFRCSLTPLAPDPHYCYCLDILCSSEHELSVRLHSISLSV